MSESALITAIRLAATRRGARLFRNNCGVAVNPKTRRPVRFGLAPGSHDLIGWTPVVIAPEHVGKTLAVFTGVEVKSGRTRVSPDQQRWHDAVANAGGISIVARSVDDYAKEIARWL